MQHSGASELKTQFSRKYEVLGLCNALIDVIISVDDGDLTSLGIEKGIMTLVDTQRQQEILAYFKGHTLDTEVGGSCPNVIRTLAGLGARTAFSGVVGADVFGNTFLEKLSSLSVDTLVNRHEEMPTGTCLILVTWDGERTMLTALGASRSIDQHSVPVAQLRHSEIFFTTGYQWDTPAQIQAINFAVRQAKASGAKVAFDLADPFCVARHREAFLALLDESLVDLVFANRDEALALTESSNPEKALEYLAKRTEVAVVKLGKQGSIAARKAQSAKIPSDHAIQVRDTTGAGDSYAGGFLFGYLRGKNLMECGTIANDCAESVIQHVGAHIPVETLKNLRLRYA